VDGQSRRDNSRGVYLGICARRAPGKLLIVRLETSISGRHLSIAHHARRLHVGHDAPDYQSAWRQSNSRASQRVRASAHVVWNETRKRALSCACSRGRPSAAFVHDLAGRRKRLMLDRSLQIEFESYRNTLSTAGRLAFDDCVERLLSQHGIDYVRGYVDALKERGSQ
jgi:hypothetical protein